jgi:hypothetical protein
MSRSDDYSDEMRTHQIDDATAEALLAGRRVADHDQLIEILGAVRRCAEGPVPTPSPALASVLADGLRTGDSDLPATVGSDDNRPAVLAVGRPKLNRRPAVLTSSLAVLSSKVGLAAVGLTAALASVGGAGAAGLLPEPVNNAVRAAITAVTDVEFSQTVAEEVPVAELPEDARFGQEIADDARGGGVGGSDVAERARARGGPDEAEVSDRGLDEGRTRSGGTPARVPGSTPASSEPAPPRNSGGEVTAEHESPPALPGAPPQQRVPPAQPPSADRGEPPASSPPERPVTPPGPPADPPK